jgi:hypothetical protein
MGEVGRHRDQQLVLMNKRQLITGVIDNFNGVINTLANRKEYLESRAASNAIDFSRNIYAHRSGVFYRRVDGYERDFTGDAVRTMDLAGFREITSREQDNYILNRAIGKVAYDYRWYFVAETNRRELADIKLVQGQRYNIICTSSPGRVIPFVFRSQISEPNAEEVLLIFETTIIPADFYFLRAQTVQVVLDEVSGIRVPDSALVVREVVRRREENAEGVMREVVEIVENSNSPASSLNVIDGELILGETVTGVYVLHGREVRFRVLDPRDIIAEFDGYTLYAVGTQRVTGSATALQADENIIVSGRNRFSGRIVG